MATSYTLTGDLSTSIGTAPRALAVSIENNLPADAALVDLANNKTLMSGPVRTDLNGTAFTVSLIATNSTGTNMADDSLRYRVNAQYVDAGRGVRTWSSPWFTLTADADLSTKTADAYASPTFVGESIATMQALVDQATTIVGIPSEDAAVATILADPDSDSHAAISDRLVAETAPRAGNIDTTVRKLRDDFADVNILVLGDSTAAQVGMFPDVLMPQVQALYPHRTLQKATWDNTGHAWGSFTTVGSAGTGANKIKFWQGAVSGTVCEQPLNYLDAWVGAVQPDLVVVHYGHNYGATAAGGGQPDDATMDRVFRERYLRFVAEVKKVCPAADILLVSQNPYLTAGTRPNLSNIRAQVVREVAADLGCAYGPVLEAYLATGDETVQATYLSGDGLHPILAGSTLAAATLLPMFTVRDRHEIVPRGVSPFQIPSRNLLTNGDFNDMPGGTSLPGWTSENVTLSKYATAFETGTYSVRGQVPANAVSRIYQSLPLNEVRGRVVTLAARWRVPAAVTSSQVGRVTLTADTMSSVTSGTITSVRDSWVWTFVTARISESTTTGTAQLLFGSTAGEYAYCDRAILAFGHLPRDAAPRVAAPTTVAPAADDALSAGQMVPRRSLMQSASVAHASGTMALSYFTADKDETINTITVYSGSVAAGTTPTLVRVGIYEIDSNNNGTLVASIANDTSIFAAANTAYQRALTAPFAKVIGRRYAVGTLVVSGASMPNLMGAVSISNSPAQGAASLPPRSIGRVLSQTDLPASFTAAGVTVYSAQNHVLLYP